jgi:hypothetical protein
MAIISTPALELTPRQELVLDIMGLLDDAIDGDEPVSTYSLAEQIAELVEERQASAST